MLTTAILYPPRENFLEAIREALADQGEAIGGLFFDGRRLAWLPRAMPGWFRLSYALIKETRACAA